jgi:uncharacterized protein YndB with AHSA1/START domain
MTNPATSSSPLSTWALEREVVLVRVINAPASAVYGAWTNADLLSQWFGPDGYATTVHEMNVAVGAITRFDMTYTDGTVYDNRFHYLEIVPNKKIVVEHGSDVDNDPGRFLVTLTFDEQSDGKTVMTLRQLHPTVEQRNTVVGFGAVELGIQTLQKLARTVEPK